MLSIAILKMSSSSPITEVEADLTAPVPTPHWGSQSGSAFTVCAKVTIKAPSQPILDALLDTSTWPQWNNFVPRATVSNSQSDAASNLALLKPGTVFIEHVDMAGRGRSTIVKMKLLMTHLDEMKEPGKEGSRVVWLGKGYPDWALRSERVHEIYRVNDAGEGEGEGGSEECVYDVYETFSGPLAWFVKVFVGKTLVKRFGQWNGELRGFVEQKAKGNQGAA